MDSSSSCTSSSESLSIPEEDGIPKPDVIADMVQPEPDGRKSGAVGKPGRKGDREQVHSTSQS